MTDPNMPPPDPVREPPHQTTINVAPEGRSGGGGVIGFLVGGLLVVVAIIAAVLYMNGGRAAAPGDTNLDVDIDIPAPRLPDAPKLPDPPTLPPVEPPTVAAPAPAN